jgi:hypothetical protein
MSSKVNIIAAAILTIFCAPAVAFDQSAAQQKANALRQVGAVEVQGLRRAAQGARAEADGYVHDTPHAAGRGLQTPAYRPQNCDNFGGNGGPVRVCW